MRPVRLTLKGFTSFRDETTLEFGNLDRFAICGPTGAGKSSLLDAMTFALFADAPRINRGMKADLIALGSKSFSVALDFRVGDQLYRITRVRRRPGGTDQLERGAGKDNFQLVQSGERAVTAAIERLLGLNYDHFTQAVFLPQGKFAEFLRTEPAKRRRLLNELLRLLVYDRMQDCAGKERDRCAGRKAEIERRLDEDFKDVTAEAQADLERQQAAQQQIAEEAGEQLAGLQERRDTLRRERNQTVELQTKLHARTQLQIKQPEIDAARLEAEAASRAIGVVPLLDQSDMAQREHTQRNEALEKAAKERDARATDHTEAGAVLNRATQEAAALPGLQEQLQRLAEAVGKLSLRDQLAHQIDVKRQQHERMAGERDEKLEESKALLSDITALESKLAQAQADLAAIGYDQNRHRRLDGLRETAARLQADRERLPEALRQAKEDEAAAAQAEEAAKQAQMDAARVEEEKKQAEQRKTDAEQALRAAEDAHRAAHLRTTLQPGKPCPVCCRAVIELPTAESVPALEERRQLLDAASKVLVRAEKAASQKDKAAATAHATAQEASRRVDVSRAEASRCSAAIVQQRLILQEKVGDLLAGDSQRPIEDRIVEAVRELTVLREQHQNAAEDVTALMADIALKRQESTAKDAEIVRLARDIQTTAEEIATTEASLEQVREQIRIAAGTDDPGSKSKQIQGEIDRLNRQLTEAARTESETKSRLDVATANVAICTREGTEAKSKASVASSQAVEGLRQAGFSDPAAARAAFRTAAQVKLLQQRVGEHESQLLALDARIAELERELQGRRVPEEVARQAEEAYAACAQRKQKADTQVALLGQQIDGMKKRLMLAGQLREEFVEHERRHRVYQRLAQDLRSDRFQAFLLEETLTSLVRDAAVHLARLTGERYGLNFTEDRIVVVDYDNAGEVRGIDTLSGGETFLASLALALALSEQVQKAVGAVHLDCLFIDEGFGTLDSETLRVVADAIRSLQVGGRMVGIITHIPELKEEFDRRVIVEKQGGISQVRIEAV